jgi:protein-disulfide isomerase
MADSSGGSTVIGAIVLAAALVVASLVVKNGLDDQSIALRGIQATLEKVAGTRVGSDARAAAAARPEAQRVPDPPQRAEIDIDGAPTRGSADAAVTIVEYSDFQCPFCSRVQPTLAQIAETYGDRVRFVYKHLPLRIHPEAPAAAAASEAAHRQGRFWEMHDRIFASQRELGEDAYRRFAEELELDVERFEKDRTSAEVKGRIQKDEQEAQRLGVSGTPAFFINGRFLSGAQPFDAFRRVIDEELEG